MSVGISGKMAGYLTPEDFDRASDDEIPVVYGLVRSDVDDPTTLEPRTRPVPSDWYDELKNAYHSRDQLDLHLDDVFFSSVIPGEYGGEVAQLVVEVISEELLDRIPDNINDIQIVASSIEDTPEPDRELPQGGSVGDIGQAIAGGNPCSNGVNVATLAPPLYDESTGSKFFTTANHLFGGDGADTRGTPCYLHSNDEHIQIGSTEFGYKREDFILVNPSEGYVPVHRIRGENPSAVAGSFTRWGLADLKARGEHLTKIGTTTGRTSGPIKMIDAITCALGICQTQQLIWGDESTFGNGDSGSVTYHVDPDPAARQLLVAGFNNARTWWPGADYTWGTAAYALMDNFGYYF